MDRKEYMREYMKKYRKDNPSYIPRTTEATRIYTRNLRDRTVELLGGYKCAKCGCDDKRVLEINHINGNGAKEIRSMNTRKYLLSIINNPERSKKYNILCKVCNAQHYVEEILGISGHSVTWKLTPL